MGKDAGNWRNPWIYFHISRSGRVPRTSADFTTESVIVHLERFTKGLIRNFDLAAISSKEGGYLLHSKEYYTVNEVPHR